MKIPAVVHLQCPIQLEAAVASAPGVALAPRTFNMDAYSGARVSLGAIDLVLDQAGYVRPTKPVPILQQHDPAKIVGLAAPSDVGFQGPTLKVKGKMYKTRAALEVMELADEGFPWQASVGAAFLEVDYVEDDEERTINGRCEKGPYIHARKWTSCESSFVPLGADSNTRSVVLTAGDSTIEVRRNTVTNPIPAPAPSTPAPVPGVNPASSVVLATPDPLVAERKRIADLRAEFSDDSQFILEHVGLGTELDAARKLYIPILRAKLARPSVESPVQGRIDGPPAGSGSAAQRWQVALAAEQVLCGGDRARATASLARRQPALREEYVAEYNTTHQPRR